MSVKAFHLSKIYDILTETGLPVERAVIGVPYLRIPVTRQPDAKEPAKWIQGAKARGRLPLVTVGEVGGSDI